MKTEKVLKGVSSVEVNSADGTTFVFDVQDLVISADDGEPDSQEDYHAWLSWIEAQNYKNSFWKPHVTYAIRGSMKPNSDGVAFTMQLPQKPVVRTASIDVESNSLPELERARKRCGAPSDALWDTIDRDDKHVVTFSWMEER